MRVVGFIMGVLVVAGVALGLKTHQPGLLPASVAAVASLAPVAAVEPHELKGFGRDLGAYLDATRVPDATSHVDPITEPVDVVQQPIAAAPKREPIEQPIEQHGGQLALMQPFSSRQAATGVGERVREKSGLDVDISHHGFREYTMVIAYNSATQRDAYITSLQDVFAWMDVTDVPSPN